jgi:predicted amidohydrolase YtcJ
MRFLATGSRCKTRSAFSGQAASGQPLQTSKCHKHRLNARSPGDGGCSVIAANIGGFITVKTLRATSAQRSHKRVGATLAALAVLFLFGIIETAEAAPDLVILDGSVLTMEPDQPRAAAIAVTDGIITHVGSTRSVRALIGPSTQVIDAAGRTIVPGFIDSHMHPRAQFDEMGPYGRLDLTPEAGVFTRADLYAKLQAKIAVTPPGQLIVGSRYQDDLIGGHPTAAELDLIAPDHPVILIHSSGHRRSVNSLALAAAGITDLTPDPPGGAIERDAAGKATGIILESVPGFQPLYEALPKPSPADEMAAYRREFEMFLSHGLVGIGDAGASPEKVEIYRTLLREGLPVRTYVMMSSGSIDWLLDNRAKPEWQLPGLTLSAVKLFHGNSLSGRTALLYEPYAHDPHYFGIAPRLNQEEFTALVRRVHDAGLQVAVHSNGDREIDMTLDAIAAALAANPRADHRHRIEHGSVAPLRILKRMLALGVGLAPHSYILNHGEKLEDFGAARWDHIEPNRTALELGIVVGGNSDHSVSPPIVMQRIESLVTRRARSNGQIYGPSQRISVEQALQTYTLGSATLQFEEDTHGSIRVGKRGDIVILSADPRKIAAEDIETILVDYTIIDGQVAYRRAHDGLEEQFGWFGRSAS